MLAALLLLAAQERELSTDRPDKTESPYTVPSGRLQIEADLASYTRDGDIRTLSIAPFNLKLGIMPDTDIQFVAEPHVREIVAGRVTDGFGDVTLRLKHNLWGNDGGKTAFALMPFVKLPTSVIGNGYVEGGIIAPLAIELHEGIGLGLMTEVDIIRTENDTAYTARFINSATVAFDLTKHLGLYTEIYTEQSAERGARFIATFDSGLTYAIGEDTQLDLGANIGITDAADDLTLFVGVSRRF